MAAAQTTLSTEMSDERATVEPFAQQLLELVRTIDLTATYTLAPPIDPGIWIMNVFVRAELVDEVIFDEALLERTTDILIHHDVGIATLIRKHRTSADAP